MSALDTQVGGDHYKKLKIQPVEYITENNMGYLEGNVIKYVTRHESKNGKADILKAIHYLEMIIERKYAEPEPEQEVGLGPIVVGDKVVCLTSQQDVTKGRVYVVNRIANDCAPIKIIDDVGDEWCLLREECRKVGSAK